MGANGDFYNSPNSWPYTNFHELNLDWILQKLKEQETDTATIKQAMNTTNERIDKTNTNVSNLSTQNLKTLEVAERGRAVHNCFDNSDFSNPVNQRGITSTSAAGYHIDRWKKDTESGTVTVGNGYLAMTGTGEYWFLSQAVPANKIKSGTVYTIALADTSGSVSVSSTVMSTDMAKFTGNHTFANGAIVSTNVEYVTDHYAVYFTSKSTAETRFAWAALYEGAYTAGTLTDYVTKGYAVELAECQRYYRPFINTAIAISISESAIEAEMALEPPMRIVPTIKINSVGSAYTPEGTKSVSVSYAATNTVNKAGYVFYTQSIGIGLSCVVTGIDGYLSADL